MQASLNSKMFNQISSRYDLLNRVLSFRQDVLWRRKIANLFSSNKKSRDQKILDLATGTGDLAFEIAKAKKGKNFEITAVDPAQGMLDVANVKNQNHKNISFKLGNALDLEFENNSFDFITIGFGVRNFENLNLGLSEMLRVLKPGGQVYILETSLPRNILFRKLFLFYFRFVLPNLGGLISGDKKAYEYLNQSAESFPYGVKFAGILRQVGFKNIKYQELSLGVASLYVASKEII